jgi:outer membrane protein, adhesin transport system
MAHHPSSAPSSRFRARLLLASASFLLATQAVDAGSIRDTVQATLDSNPEIGIVKSNRHAVDQELRQARAGYYP